MGLDAFKLSTNDKILKISFTAGIIFGYWLSLTMIFIFFELYNRKRKERILKEFNYNPKLIKREEMIESIIGG